MGVEIEKKFLVSKENADKYYKMSESGELKFHEIEQAYITTDPVIRARKQDDEYYVTYKGEGTLIKEEYNLPLNEESYNTLKSKADGNVISKRRILIPYGKHTIEFDIFHAPFEDYTIAEVEFESLEDAEAFVAPDWFLEEVTGQAKYSNAVMSRMKF